MRISVRVKPNSKEDRVEKLNDAEYSMRVKAAPKEGKANEAVIKILSGYFDIPKSRISISRGLKGKVKIIDIK